MISKSIFNVSLLFVLFFIPLTSYGAVLYEQTVDSTATGYVVGADKYFQQTVVDCTEVNGTVDSISFYSNSSNDTAPYSEITTKVNFNGVDSDTQVVSGTTKTLYTYTVSGGDFGECTTGTTTIKFIYVSNGYSEGFRMYGDTSDTYTGECYSNYNSRCNTVVDLQFTLSGTAAASEETTTIITLPILYQLSTSTCDITATTAVCTYEYSTTTEATSTPLFDASPQNIFYFLLFSVFVIIIFATLTNKLL